MNSSQRARWGNYGMMGSNHLKTPNEPNGLEIWFYFREDGNTQATITISDVDGKDVFKRDIDATKGIKKVYWNTMMAAPGTYTINMTYNGTTITKRGVVTERYIWPVLNYRSDNR
ncbi:MAG: T9SS type A sorting domain-containing protein [Bacteroidales bacterium]